MFGNNPDLTESLEANKPLILSLLDVGFGVGPTQVQRNIFVEAKARQLLTKVAVNPLLGNVNQVKGTPNKRAQGDQDKPVYPSFKKCLGIFDDEVKKFGLDASTPELVTLRQSFHSELTDYFSTFPKDDKIGDTAQIYKAGQSFAQTNYIRIMAKNRAWKM